MQNGGAELPEFTAKQYNDYYAGAGKKDYSAPYESSIYIKMWRDVYIRLRPYKSILDLGCGTGQFAEGIPSIVNYMGVDFSSVAIEQAKQRNKYFKFTCDDVFSAIGKMNLGKYEVVVMLEFLEHIWDDLRLMNQIKGKRYIASVPSFMSDTHVRYFSSEHEVLEKYKDSEITTIQTYKIDDRNRIFLFGNIP